MVKLTVLVWVPLQVESEASGWVNGENSERESAGREKQTRRTKAVMRALLSCCGQLGLISTGHPPKN